MWRQNPVSLPENGVGAVVGVIECVRQEYDINGVVGHWQAMQVPDCTGLTVIAGFRVVRD